MASIPLTGPLTAPPLTAPFTTSTMLTDVALPTPFPKGISPPDIIVHIPTDMSTPDPATIAPTSPAPAVTSGVATSALAPPLSAAEWLCLITKVQSGELPPFTIAPLSATSPLPNTVVPPSKVFMAQTAIFSLDSDPGALLDCLVQMALNKIFIPLSMLTMSSLNRIEHNDVKYKHLNYGSGAGKTFLDDSSFPAEDELNDFEFGQAYTNWLTLIETVSDLVVKKGWHAHHKHMTSDREFLDWALAWHTHDRMLRTHFMLKPFILDLALPSTRSNSNAAS